MFDAFSIAQMLSAILWGLIFSLAGMDVLKERPILGLAIFGLGFFFVRIAADLLEQGRPDRIVAAMIYWTVTVGVLFIMNKAIRDKYGD